MIDFKNKKTTWWLIGLLVLVILLILFFKGLEGKNILGNHNTGNNLVDIANSEDYSKYTGKVNASFEGDWVLNFSFLHKNDIQVEQGTGAQAKWFKLINASGTNEVTLYFTYEGGRGFTTEDYINEVLKVNDSVTVEDVKFTESDSPLVKRVVNTKDNVEYYLEAFKGEDGSPWLAIVENNQANNEITSNTAKDLIRSLELVTQ